MREKSEKDLREEREFEEQKMLETKWEEMGYINTKGKFLFRIVPNREMASAILNRAVEELQKMVLIQKEAIEDMKKKVAELKKEDVGVVDVPLNVAIEEKKLEEVKEEEVKIAEVKTGVGAIAEKEITGKPLDVPLTESPQGSKDE